MLDSMGSAANQCVLIYLLFVAAVTGCVSPRQGGPRDIVAESAAALERGQTFSRNEDGPHGRLLVEMADDSNNLFLPKSLELAVDKTNLPPVDISILGSGQSLLVLDVILAPGPHRVDFLLRYRGNEKTIAREYSWEITEARKVEISAGHSTTLRARFILHNASHFSDQPNIRFEGDSAPVQISSDVRP